MGGLARRGVSDVAPCDDGSAAYMGRMRECGIGVLDKLPPYLHRRYVGPLTRAGAAAPVKVLEARGKENFPGDAALFERRAGGKLARLLDERLSSRSPHSGRAMSLGKAAGRIRRRVEKAIPGVASACSVSFGI